MWETIKLTFYAIWLLFVSLIGIIGLIWQGLEYLFVTAPKEQREKELEEREYQVKLAEAKRDLRGPHPDALALEAHATELVARAAIPSWEGFLDGWGDRFRSTCARECGMLPAMDIQLPLMESMIKLYIDEGLDQPPSHGVLSGMIDVGRYKDELIAYVKKIEDPAKVLDTFARLTTESAVALTMWLPQFAREPLHSTAPESSQATSVALTDILPNMGQVVEDLVQPFYSDQSIGLGLFQEFRAKYDKHVAEEKHIPSADKRSSGEIAQAYLAGTRLEQIFSAKAPFEIPIARRLEHTAVVAGSGWGKTQLLQSIIARDLQSEQPVGIVVIDSTGAMVHRIQRLALFNQQLKDRLIIIDPELAPSPALNMFDISNPRFRAYDDASRESIESEIVALFNYVFSSTDNPLTAQQATPFAFMVRLLLSLPGANINTLIELLEDNPRTGYEGASAKFKRAIEQLDETSQTFFKTQYYSRGTSEARRDQIAQRVYGVIKVPAFQRMFSGVNKLDMFAELNRSAIILVNTNENLLKEASPTFAVLCSRRHQPAGHPRISDLLASFLIH